MKPKIFWTVIGGILLVIVGLVIWSVFASKGSVPSDIPLDPRTSWSKPVRTDCYWSNLQGEEKNFKGYEVKSSIGEVGLAEYEDLMRKSGWQVDNWLDATTIGAVTFSKDGRYAYIQAVAYPEGDPSSKLAKLSICYTK